jgi:hypothetical protein
MRLCFICGADWDCSHREPELLAWEYKVRRARCELEEKAVKNSILQKGKQDASTQFTPRTKSA